MKVNVKKPVVVRVDNVGAIFMGENCHLSERTKHIDIRAKYIIQEIERENIKLMFVRSENNLSDFLTKNVKGEIFEKHVHAYVAKLDAVIKELKEVSGKGVGEH